MHDGTFSMKFDGEIVKFNIYKTMKYPDDVSSIYGIDFIDPLVEEIFYLTCDGLIDCVATTLEDCVALDAPTNSISRNYRPSPIALPISNTKLLPSVVQATKLELKELPNQLKYVYLGEHETLLWVGQPK